MRRREDGEVRRRAQVGTNAWRTVEGVMADRRTGGPADLKD